MTSAKCIALEAMPFYEKSASYFFGIFICLIFFLVTDCFVNSTSRASRAATIASCWGDSITRGYPYQATGENYPMRLQGMLDAAYGSGSYQVINRGVDAYRADQVRAKASAWLAADSPDIVLLMIGTNDITHGQTIESTRVEVQEIINLVTGHTNPDGSHPRIIVSSVIPSLTYESWLLGLYNDDLASHLTGMASWFTFNWGDFYDGGTGLAKMWLMADDIHPNSAGYKVMAENWLGVIRSLPENRAPHTPSAPTGPSSGDPGVSYSFSTTTTDPDGNQISFQFDWGDGIHSNWSTFVDSGSSVTMSHSWSGQGTFRVKVRAKDSHNNQSAWSAAHEMIVVGQPPHTPSAPTGPDSGNPGTSYSFTATTTDPNEDQISFQFDWGDGIHSNWSTFVDSGSSVTMSHSWSDKGSYYVRVRAKNSYSDTSDWSSGHSIVITTVVLEVDPLSLSFGDMETGSTKTMTLQVYNSEDGTLSGTISADSNWISVNPTSFEGNEHTISVTVNTENLAESTTPYGGTITVTSNGGTKTVEISVAVIPAGAVAYPNPFSLSRHAGLTFWGTSVAHAKIQIFTLTGELVKTLKETYGAGKVLWDGRNEKGVKVARGVYIFVVGSYSGKIAIVE